jgi:formamidase
MKKLAIDRRCHLGDQPDSGHNRWHPELEPRIEIGEGEELGIETRDAVDGYVTPQSTIADFASLQLGVLHPLTGPVYVKNAEPGDLLEVEFLDIVPGEYGYTLVVPGMGFIPDAMPNPFIAHWKLTTDGATSEQVPGVRIPRNAFMGISGVAPSAAQVAAWTARELPLAKQGMAMPPDPTNAVPSGGAAALQGLRTLPPRENGGNMDVKQLTAGAKLFLPVNVPGALFSTGDAHFAQGDGEVCLTAIEMPATCVLRFKVHKGQAKARKIAFPYYSRDTYFANPSLAAPEKFVATMGIPVDHEGNNRFGDLNLASRNAILNMISLLEERGFTREQAYVICSVAVDLRINNVVDVPNCVVSAILPEAIFRG